MAKNILFLCVPIRHLQGLVVGRRKACEGSFQKSTRLKDTPIKKRMCDCGMGNLMTQEEYDNLLKGGQISRKWNEDDDFVMGPDHRNIR